MRPILSVVVLSSSILVAQSAVAHAAYAVPEAPYSSTSQGKSFWRDITNLLLQRVGAGCVADDPDKWRGQVTEWTNKAAALKDAADQALYGDFMVKVSEHVEAHLEGVPGIGTYAALAKKYAVEEAVVTRAMAAPTPGTADEAAKVVALYRDFRKHAKVVTEMAGNIYNESWCSHHAGDWAGLSKTVVDGERQVAGAIAEVTGPILTDYATWRSTAPLLDAAVPTIWDDHAKHTVAVVELARLTQKLASNAALLAAYAPVLDGDARAAATEAPGKISAALAPALTLAGELIAAVKMPGYKKDKARAKLVDKALKGSKTGKRVGVVMSPAGSSEQKWTEDQLVKSGKKIVSKTFKVTRKHYSTYYAWDPTTTPAELPDLPGLDEGSEICELHVQNFAQYAKGGPAQKPLGKWFAWDGWRTSWILCKNADDVTALKMK